MSEKHPCQKDCPERSATCHTTCKRYMAHYNSQRTAYAERQKAINQKQDLEAYVQKLIEKNKRNGFRRKRR